MSGTLGQWPLEGSGLTESEVPADYNVFPDMFNDGRGYEPIIVGREILENGMQRILISLSPGVHLSATLPIGDEAQVRAALEATKALADRGRHPLPAGPSTPPEGLSGAPEGLQRGE